jgi:hypothetical protein
MKSSQKPASPTAKAPRQTLVMDTSPKTRQKKQQYVPLNLETSSKIHPII